MMLQIVDLTSRQVVGGIAGRGNVNRDRGRLNDSVTREGRRGRLCGFKAVDGYLRRRMRV